MGRLATRRRVYNPITHHDPGRLADAVRSIKASFRQLDTSGVQLERSVGRQRTRLLMHIMGARSQSNRETEIAKKAEIYKRYGKGSRAAEAQLQSQRKWLPREVTEDASSCASDEASASNESSESEDEVHRGEDIAQEQCSVIIEETLSALGSCLLTQSDRPSVTSSPTARFPSKAYVHSNINANSLSRRGSIECPSLASSQRIVRPSSGSPVPSMPHLYGSIAASTDVFLDIDSAQIDARQSRPNTASSTPRPCVSVSTKRPFSAPRMRWVPHTSIEVDAPNENPIETSGANAVGKQRPLSGRVSGRHDRPTSATPRVTLPVRPGSAPGTMGRRSTLSEKPCAKDVMATPTVYAGDGLRRQAGGRPGFGGLQRRQQLGRTNQCEKPVATPVWEPQTRFMGVEDCPPFVDWSAPVSTSARPTSAPVARGSHFGGRSGRGLRQRQDSSDEHSHMERQD